MAELETASQTAGERGMNGASYRARQSFQHQLDRPRGRDWTEGLGPIEVRDLGSLVLSSLWTFDALDSLTPSKEVDGKGIR